MYWVFISSINNWVFVKRSNLLPLRSPTPVLSLIKQVYHQQLNQYTYKYIIPSFEYHANYIVSNKVKTNILYDLITTLKLI
jgi:hypothetical protein